MPIPCDGLLEFLLCLRPAQSLRKPSLPVIQPRMMAGNNVLENPACELTSCTEGFRQMAFRPKGTGGRMGLPVILDALDVRIGPACCADIFLKARASLAEVVPKSGQAAYFGRARWGEPLAKGTYGSKVIVEQVRRAPADGTGRRCVRPVFPDCANRSLGWLMVVRHVENLYHARLIE